MKTPTMKRTTLLAGVVSGLLGAMGAVGAQGSSQAPKSDVLVRAMHDELTRSMEQLRLDTLPKPYFIAYRVSEAQSVGASARLGALVGQGDFRGSRILQVEVRVGDYAFDNTNYFGAGFLPTQYVGFGALPVDDDYQELRRQIWLSTDRAYKQALEALSQKKAALETRSRTEDLADFSHEPMTNTVDEVPPPAPPNRQALEALARDLSATFHSASEIYSSSVGVATGWSRTVYMNSEGTSYVRAEPHASVSAQASTQATDGTALSMSYLAQANTFAELPSRDSLMKGVRELATRLTAQRHVPLADAYDGPVLFDGAAAAELFNQLVASRLIGSRQPITSPTFARVIAGGGNDWADLIGSLVMPRWMSVVDDPSVRTMDGRPVESFRVDEDGVATRATTVVDHGMLKTLLTSRTPVTGVDHSTGNRFGGGPRPMHVMVNADSALSDADMRRKLITLAAAQGRPYGVIVRQLSGPGTVGEDPEAMVAMFMGQQDRAAPVVRGMRAVKIFADGHEEPMRGALISGLNATGFKDIAAASQGRTLHTDVFFSGASPFAGNAGSGTVTYLMPSLLFANLSIRKPRGTTPTLPVVPPPP
jgi:PmbA/TldA metallopeptidase C-terminal domain